MQNYCSLKVSDVTTWCFTNNMCFEEGQRIVGISVFYYTFQGSAICGQFDSENSGCQLARGYCCSSYK